MKLNLNFDLYKGTTRLKQWWKEVKAHFTQVQEAHNALDTTVSTHKTAAIIDHPDESITTEKIADRSITTGKLSLDLLKEIAKIPEFLYYEAEPVYLSSHKGPLGYELPADIPVNVLFILENDTDSSLSEFRTHDDYYTPLSCKIPSGETRICILLKRASGGAEPQDGYLFVLDDVDTQKLISKETSERKKADTTLQQNIDTEAVNRQTADNALQQAIDDEAESRQTLDKNLTVAINGEAYAREAADNALEMRIENVEDKAHTHENKTVLDGITAEDILNWNDKITYEPATSSANGLMSAEDKAKLDGIDEGATKTVVDDALNVTSTNPLQNKAVTTELKKKVSVYKVSDFVGADTYYRLPFEVGEYFILKNDGTEDISKLLYGYNESWYNPSAYYWFSNTIKAGNTALCYMKEDVVDAGDIDGHDGEILSYELNESFAQILQNQSKITALQQHVTDREIFVMCDGDHDELKIQAALDAVKKGGVVYPVTSNGDVVVLTNANTNKGYSPITAYDVVLKVGSNKTLDFRFCDGVMFDNTNPGNNQAIFQLSEYAEIKNLWTFSESSDTCTTESINPTVLYTANYCIVDNCNFDTIQGMNTKTASQFLFKTGRYCKFRNNTLNGISLNNIASSQRGFDFGIGTVVENNIFQNIIASAHTGASIFYFTRCFIENNTFSTFNLCSNYFYMSSGGWANSNYFYMIDNISFRFSGNIDGNTFTSITAGQYDTLFLADNNSNVFDNIFSTITANSLNDSYELVTVNGNATFSNNKMYNIMPSSSADIPVVYLNDGAIFKDSEVKLKSGTDTAMVVMAEDGSTAVIKNNITNAASIGTYSSTCVVEGNITGFGA